MIKLKTVRLTHVSFPFFCRTTETDLCHFLLNSNCRCRFIVALLPMLLRSSFVAAIDLCCLLASRSRIHRCFLQVHSRRRFLLVLLWSLPLPLPSRPSSLSPSLPILTFASFWLHDLEAIAASFKSTAAGSFKAVCSLSK